MSNENDDPSLYCNHSLRLLYSTSSGSASFLAAEQFLLVGRHKQLRASPSPTAQQQIVMYRMLTVQYRTVCQASKHAHARPDLVCFFPLRVSLGDGRPYGCAQLVARG